MRMHMNSKGENSCPLVEETIHKGKHQMGNRDNTQTK